MAMKMSSPPRSHLNSEEESYSKTMKAAGESSPASTSAAGGEESWPASPCLVKNTFLHFVADEAAEPADEIDVLKGYVSRRRSSSEPPTPVRGATRKLQIASDADDDSSDDEDDEYRPVMGRSMSDKTEEPHEVRRLESRVATMELESRVATAAMEAFPELRLNTLDLAEIDIGAHGIYGTEWEARIAMNNLDLSVNPIASMSPSLRTSDTVAYAHQLTPPMAGYAGFQQTPPTKTLMHHHAGNKMPQQAQAQAMSGAAASSHNKMQAELAARQQQAELARQQQVVMQKHAELPQGLADRGPKEDPMPWSAGVVTVMVRQVPRRYSSQMQLLDKIAARGFQGAINFLYLPFDMKKGVNVGYCFVGFTEHEHALRFRDVFDGAYLDKNSQAKDKPLRVHPASVQGYQASCEHFARTKTGQKQDRRFSPLFLGSDGRIPPATALLNSRFPSDSNSGEGGPSEAYGDRSGSGKTPMRHMQQLANAQRMTPQHSWAGRAPAPAPAPAVPQQMPMNNMLWRGQMDLDDATRMQLQQQWNAR